MRLVVAGEHETRCSNRLRELAVDAVHETGRIEIPAERVQRLRRRLGMVGQCFRPCIKPRRATGHHWADAADRLRQYCGLYALGVMLEHVHDERPADALTVEMAAVDTQAVEQRDVVGRVRVPAVLRGDRGTRLAAGVAL